ncbi:MAG: ADP-ribosylglycohydrolase family protein [Anaerolineales bacterium]
MNQIDRFRGCLLGLAAGDALGTTLEFKPPGSFAPIDDIGGGGPFNLAAGQWTDDTSMALCLAASLVECKGMDLFDQSSKYVNWYRQGYMSSTGVCFDIGNTVRKALENFEKTGDPYSGLTDPYSAGNGSIMRLAPVPMFYSQDNHAAMHNSGLSSKTTHATRVAVDACRFFGALICGALNGINKDRLLSDDYFEDDLSLIDEIQQIAGGSYKRKEPPEIRGTGYVVNSLEAALWAFYRSCEFKSGCLMAVNLGDDSDTTGAVYGQIAGAFYGMAGIPENWRSILSYKELIRSYADQLHKFSDSLRS